MSVYAYATYDFHLMGWARIFKFGIAKSAGEIEKSETKKKMEMCTSGAIFCDANIFVSGWCAGKLLL